MPGTYIPIATTTLTGTTASYSFTSIPQTYTDLVLRIAPLATNNNGRAQIMYFNDDGGANYTWLRLYGASNVSNTMFISSLTTSGAMSIGAAAGAGSSIDSGNLIEWNILNYSNSTYNKNVLAKHRFQEDADGAREIGRFAGVWKNNNAITKITVAPGSGDYVSGTVITLFGIKAA